MFELTPVKRLIKTARGKKLFVLPLLYYITISHDKYAVSFSYGRQSVGHDKAGPTLHQFRKSILNLKLCPGIY